MNAVLSGPWACLKVLARREVNPAQSSLNSERALEGGLQESRVLYSKLTSDGTYSWKLLLSLLKSSCQSNLKVIYVVEIKVLSYTSLLHISDMISNDLITSRLASSNGGKHAEQIEFKWFVKPFWGKLLHYTWTEQCIVPLQFSIHSNSFFSYSYEWNICILCDSFWCCYNCAILPFWNNVQKS